MKKMSAEPPVAPICWMPVIEASNSKKYVAAAILSIASWIVSGAGFVHTAGHSGSNGTHSTSQDFCSTPKWWVFCPHTLVGHPTDL